MKKLALVLVLLATFALASPARAFVGAQVHSQDQDTCEMSADGWITGLYVSGVECNSSYTIIYFTNGMYLATYYSATMTLLAQNALYANRTVALKVSGGTVSAYRLR